MIRVAYDVSSVAPPPGATRMVTGIGRVIEEQLACLRKNPDLQMKAIGGFGQDWNPVITSLSAERWAKLICQPPIARLQSFRTRSNIVKAAAGLLYRLEERATGAGGIRQRLYTLAAALLRRAVRAGVRIGLDRSEVDLFHATFRSPPEWLAKSMPRVITVHDVIPVRHAEECGPAATGMLKSLLAALDPQRDVVVTVSKFTKDDFCDVSGFPRERVVVAQLSAARYFHPVDDPERIARARGRWGLGDDPFLLSVANPQPRKNIPFLIRAFFTAAGQLPEWKGKLVLVGNPKAGWGSDKIHLEIAKRPERADQIIWAAGVSDEDLACLYSECEAFVFPSTYEGFGLPVLEALQCGAPVICSNRSSLPEVVGDAAILVDPTDEAGLVKAIVGLVTTPDRGEELRRLGVQQAAKFSWELSAENVAKAYRMALGASAGREGDRNTVIVT
jgi:glycosyltransferase involved in cell wall biosynthesis